ncbi:MAG: penicillin-binding protein 2 [Patescibacteria group bacterium]|mgnify:CR=1 FL=1
MIQTGYRHFKNKELNHSRITAGYFIVLFVSLALVARLFVLMILQHDFYAVVASGAQEMYAQLFPRRGQTRVIDARNGQEYPAAINRDVFLMYADTRQITTDAMASSTAVALSSFFSYDEEYVAGLYAKLNKRSDPYEPIEKKVDEITAAEIKKLKLPGLYFSRHSERFYPEASFAAQVIGFLGKDDIGTESGRYGVEGYWQNELGGSGGFQEGAQSAGGSWIAGDDGTLRPATDGADIILTIDRTLQFEGCEKLKSGMEEYGAASASMVIMDPKTGAVLAMCSAPDFDLNSYNQVNNPEMFNNSAIFTPYEPGSIFKPIVMAGALNENVVGPASPFRDNGRRDGICDQPIQNAGNKSFGDQTMTGVLQNSINTGMVYVAESLGKDKFKEYLKKFGFGVKTGIELDTETTGVIDSLNINKSGKFDCYTATAAFGQGITVTPLQITNAFAAIANGGALMRPYIVKEIRYSDGKVNKTKPQVINEVLDKKAAGLLAGMLVKTVDKGYSGRARVPGYFVAGKSGTAEIAGRGGYTKTYNHSFIGFAPIDDPKFVMFVKYEKPLAAYAESTAAPVFGKMAKFILEYFQVPPERPVDDK